MTSKHGVVVLWGAGHPEMLHMMRQTVARGATVVAWDGAYWHRDRYYRCSINAPHPEAIVMARPRTPDRWLSFGIQLRDEWNPRGPIVIVGQGVKCAAMYAEPVGEWEYEAARRVRARYPDRPIHFRPRPQGRGHQMDVRGCVTRNDARIEDVLRGASLVVTRHSNVGVDAIVTGIPVVSVSGAAAAVCPRRVEDAGEPLSEETRLQFLANLAWFQWTAEELRQPSTWPIIEEMAACV